MCVHYLYMEREKIIKILKDTIAENHISKAYLFGSFARKKGHYNDIDIAFDPPPGFTLLDLSRIANQMEKKTRISIDLITIRSIHPKLKNAIKKEMIAL